MRPGDTAHNVLNLFLNDRDIRCQVTLQLIEVWCTYNLIPKQSFEPAAFVPFSADASITGTLL